MKNILLIVDPQNDFITGTLPVEGAEETDYFVKCSIPEYDESDVWFVRHVDGGWFSMDTQSYWMSGRLTPADFDWDEYQAEVARELSEWLQKHKNEIKNDPRRKNVVD